jgi:hypothetical protein
MSGKRMIGKGRDAFLQADHGDFGFFISLRLDPVVGEHKVADWIADVT